jgi:hypothetical protein
MTTLQALIKHAEAVAESSVPAIDNHKIALRERRANNEDTRATLSGLFSNLAAASKKDSAEVRKLFPKYDHDIPSSPLLKLASVNEIEAMRRGFLTELEKL